MHDYKFRQNQTTLDNPRRHRPKTLRRTLAVLAVAGILYALVHLVSPRSKDPAAAAEEQQGTPDVISLPIPPYRDPAPVTATADPDKGV